MKKFDLNVEKILENWETHHAIREIIANAIDEQILTKTKDVEIFKKGSSWIIRDFGRGLKYTHLTQNENQEKLLSTSVVGKFGVGLKDALATFDRRGVVVTAKSKHNQITIAKSPKQGFQDIVTLHAIIEDQNEVNFAGTEFELSGVTDKDIEAAKKLFLKFSGEEIIENTRQGQVIKRNERHGNIYINGVKVAEEENFLYSYNITMLSTPIKKALNRERTNVGRSAYANSVKILLSSTKKEVAEMLARDLQNITRGTLHDELSWVDVQEHSVKILNQHGKHLFVTSSEMMQHPDMLDQARTSGHEIIPIPDNLKFKIQDAEDLSGNPIIDFDQFVENYNDSFEFSFIDPGNLNDKEKAVYQHTSKILGLFGGMPKNVRSIKISSTIRKDYFAEAETLGCWDEKSNSIVLSRKTLKSISDYSGTLIHELIHAKTGYSDVTRAFELSLTEGIGDLCKQLLLAIKRKSHLEVSSVEEEVEDFEESELTEERQETNSFDCGLDPDVFEESYIAAINKFGTYFETQIEKLENADSAEIQTLKEQLKTKPYDFRLSPDDCDEGFIKALNKMGADLQARIEKLVVAGSGEANSSGELDGCQEWKPFECVLDPEEYVEEIVEVVGGIVQSFLDRIHSLGGDPVKVNYKDHSDKRPVRVFTEESLARAGRFAAFYYEGGLRQFENWSAEMLKEMGESVRPHLKKLHADAKAQVEAYYAEEGLDLLPEVSSVEEETVTKLENRNMKNGSSKLSKRSDTEGEAEIKRLAAKVNEILHNGKYEGELAERMRKEMGIKGAEKPEQ